MKRITRLLGVVTALVALTLGMATASAETTTNSPVLESIEKSRTLRVGMTGAQPPFNVKSKTGELIGMDVDIARLLASAMRVELEIVEKPFVDLLPALEDNEVDLVISGVTSTLKRNMRVPFVGPYFVSGISILTKSDVLATVSTAQQLNDEKLRIAALRGSTSEDLVEAALNKPSFTAVKEYDDAIKMLLDGDIDALVADAPICALSVLRYPDQGLVALSKPLTIEPIGIAVAPGDPLLINLVQNYMQALEATGALEQLQKKWFKSGAWLIQLP